MFNRLPGRQGNRSTLKHLLTGQHSKFVDRSRLKWVKSACASTVMVQSSFRVCCSSRIYIEHLLQDKDSKSTNTSTKLAIDLLKQFCAAKGRAFKKQSLEKSELNGLPKSITGELFII